VTRENAKTHSWVTETVWQRISGRRAGNSETPTTITVQSIPRNDHLPLIVADRRCWLVNRSVTCGISSLLHSVNLIVSTLLLVHLILSIITSSQSPPSFSPKNHWILLF